MESMWGERGVNNFSFTFGKDEIWVKEEKKINKDIQYKSATPMKPHKASKGRAQKRKNKWNTILGKLSKPGKRNGKMIKCMRLATNRQSQNIMCWICFRTRVVPVCMWGIRWDTLPAIFTAVTKD
jgi:hypothetical protein